MKILRWQPRKLAKLTCGFVTLCMMVLIIHVIHTVWVDNKCSMEESSSLLEDVCQRYRDHSVDGNLCNDLCEKQTINFVKCTNYRRGKKVLIMECDGGCLAGETIKVVMKNKPRNKDEEYDRLVLPLNDDGTVSKDGLEIAKILMKNKAFGDMHFTVSSKQNIFSELWSMDLRQYVKSATYKNADHVALLNIWSLLQQDEYLFMKVYQDVPYVPRLYGTCGEFYFMEYAPPGDILSPGFFVTTPWSKRAEIALKLMDVAQSFDTDFHQPLHFCDVKVDNFGVGADLRVKILDSDSLFFDEKMSMNLKGHCTQDLDCDFFDCRGSCDVHKKTCNGRRVNNNLQNICEDIFIDRPPNFFRGLLHDAPPAIAGELTTVLQDCAYPNKNIGKVVRSPTATEVMEKLYKLLQTKTH
ncbi:LOW QUALITY PROTEIN: divergent protein kinase domain 1C-like [Pecten maximus]|uniref:LOW QUALITY PROTEIN: divergent protein kinase domain 1C-like n=1 Tax=Pecten maximus TaxID=6579 RepID=UPI001458310C|nr:LOW QUALITY PROTEIN: divergent protein kinase domain 1C-like [Pecten maximus]